MFKDYIKDKKAVCFDLDGTLVDSLPLWEEAVRNTLNKITAIDVKDLSDIYRGVHLSKLYTDVLDKYQIKTVAMPSQLAVDTKQEFLRILEKQENMEPRDGFWDLAEELKIHKNMKLALVSNSDRQVVNKIAELTEVANVFDVIVAGDEVNNRKPHPEIYQKTAKKLEVRPDELLVFEDSPEGAASANKAGADIIIIWNADIRESEYPSRVLAFQPDFGGLRGYLDMDYIEYVKKMAQEPDPYAKPRLE